MRVLTYLVPILLLAFFLRRGRRDPAYILAIPLVLAFNRGIFLDLHSFRISLGNFSISQEEILLAALVAVLVYAASLRPRAPRQPFTFQIYLCGGILLLLLGKAFAVDIGSWSDLLSSSRLLAAVKASLLVRVYFYLPISIILWHFVLKRFTADEMGRMLRAITWVTLVCSIVYVADLLGIKTYSNIYVVYATMRLAPGFHVFRDFLTFPFWLNLALGYSLACVVYARQRTTYALVAVVLTSCAALSFTRSFIISAIVLWVAALAWRVAVVSRRGRERTRHGTMGPVTASALVAGVAGLGSAFDRLATMWGYLLGRMSAVTSGALGDPNVAIRVNLYSIAAAAIKRDGLLFGTLLTDAGASGSAYFLDSYWASVLLAYGWLGGLIVAALLAAAVVKAVARALRAQTDAAIPRLAILLGLLMALLDSFTGSGWQVSVAALTFLIAAPDVAMAPSVGKNAFRKSDLVSVSNPVLVPERR
jgi:hypothetical protein